MPKPSPFQIGKNYFFRLATYHVVGCVSAQDATFITLKCASWISDSGRLSNALKTGFEQQSASEIEPTGDHIIAVAAIIDAIPYSHQLPEKQK